MAQFTVPEVPQGGSVSAQHTPGPWGSLSDAERARIYQDESLRRHDIDWYRFHGIDPRQDGTEGCASVLWCASRKTCLRSVARVAKATGSAS